jgi:hypothetical protein
LTRRPNSASAPAIMRAGISSRPISSKKSGISRLCFPSSQLSAISPQLKVCGFQILRREASSGFATIN